MHTRYMKSRQEAALNPITGRHLDSKVENTLKQSEVADMVTRANRGQDRALAVETNYDVVNFQSKREGLDPKDTSAQKEVIKTYIPDSRVPYNILSTLSHEQHHWAHPDLRPKETVVDPKTRFASKFIGRQPYNVINNKYLDKNEEKVAAENTEARHKAVKAFWKTHSYDPVAIKYYDDEKESDYWRQHRESEKTQGQSVAENIRRNAPTAHLAEGNLCDPITCQPKNEDAIKQLHRLEQGQAEHTQGVLQRVGEYLQNEDDFAMVQDDRALNRTKWERFEDDHSHGCDIINNVPHFARGAAHKFLPKARPQPTMWEQINEEALNCIDAQPLQELPSGSVEPGRTATVNPDVPPLKTRPFTHDSVPQSMRSSPSRRSEGGGASVSRSRRSQHSARRTPQGGEGGPVAITVKQGLGVSQGGGSMSRRSGGSSRRSNVSTSGRVRTGAFQHLDQ